MKKPIQQKQTSRTQIGDLAPRGMTSEEFIKVVGGMMHDCVTASGACDGDDCGAIPVGSHCGP